MEMTWLEVARNLESRIEDLHEESLGHWDWGVTEKKGDLAHVGDYAKTLESTREHFLLEGPTAIHGVFVKGSDLKLAMVGNSPTSEARAAYIATLSPANVTEIIAYIREKESVK